MGITPLLLSVKGQTVPGAKASCDNAVARLGHTLVGGAAVAASPLLFGESSFFELFTMRKFFTTLLATVTFAILPFISAFSQSPDTLPDGSVREVIVSALRREQPAAEATRSVTVITSEQLRQTAYVNVGDLLTRQLGLYVVGAGQTPGQLQSLFLRGASANQTAIFLDGVRLYEPSSPEAAADLSELSLANVERIEIVRGSHSALFGSGAVGGTVNIVTKGARKPGFGGFAEARGGSFGPKTFFGSGDLGLQYAHSNGLYANIGAHHNTVDGLDATVDSTTVPTGLERDRDGFKKTDWYAKMGLRRRNWSAFAGYRHADQLADIDDGAFRDDPNHTSGQQRHALQYGVSFDAGARWHVDFHGGWTQLRRMVEDDSSLIVPNESDHSFFTSTLRGQTLTHELQGIWSARGAKLTFGAFHFKESMSSKASFFSNGPFGSFGFDNNVDSLDASTGGIFAQVETKRPFGRKKAFHFNAGARLADHSAFGPVFTVNINPALALNGHTMLFLAYTTGFNAPSLYQLYAPEADFTSGITRGNPTLEQERSASLELGIRQQKGQWSWSLSFFQNMVENALQYAYLWPAEKPIDQLGFLDYRGDTYINTGHQSARGMEAGIAWKPSARWSLGGNVALLDTRLEVDADYQPSEHTRGYRVQLYNSGRFLEGKFDIKGLVRRPNTANLYAEYKPLKTLALRADLRHAGSRPDVFYDYALGPFGALNQSDVAAYTLADLTVRWDVTKNLRLTLRGENLADAQYQEIWGYSTRGRSFFAALRCDF